MLIGIISDTHDRLPATSAALRHFKQAGVELVIHCGDWKSVATFQYIATQTSQLGLTLKGVLGNNDTAVTDFLTAAHALPKNVELTEGILSLQVEGRRIAAYHGHHKPTLRKLLVNHNHDIILLGHSHKPKIEMVADKLIINPGSTAFAIPRSKSWQPSAALLNTGTMAAEIAYFNPADLL